MGKFYNIDPETCSREELLSAIAECDSKADFYHTEEQGVKTFLNSVYGAMASKYYSCNNLDIAESITLQGQDLIKYSVRVINGYFSNDWHRDTNAHISIAKKMVELYPSFDAEKFLKLAKNPVQFGETLQVYGDTDSAYISLHPIIKSCDIAQEFHTDFILCMNEFILDGFLNKQFDKYATDWNCPENKEKFELEKIARSVIMLAKKKYVMDIAWTDDGTYHKPLQKMIYKGIELVQGSTPEFCRKEMKEFIKFIVSEINTGKVPEYKMLSDKIREIKKRFSIQSPNDISKTFKVSEYEKFVLNDKVTPIEYIDTKMTVITDEDSGDKYNKIITNPIPIHVRAASKYNNMLYTSAKKYRSKYSFIKKDDKIKFYYVDNDNVFAFLPNAFPVEFAPPMDIDLQFEKLILAPLNRIVNAIGYDDITANNVYTISLF